MDFVIDLSSLFAVRVGFASPDLLAVLCPFQQKEKVGARKLGSYTLVIVEDAIARDVLIAW